MRSGRDEVSRYVGVVCLWQGRGVFAPHDVTEAKQRQLMAPRRAGGRHVVVPCPPLAARPDGKGRRQLAVQARPAAAATRPAELATKLGCTRANRHTLSTLVYSTPTKVNCSSQTAVRQL